MGQGRRWRRRRKALLTRKSGYGRVVPELTVDKGMVAFFLLPEVMVVIVVLLQTDEVCPLTFRLMEPHTSEIYPEKMSLKRNISANAPCSH